MRECGNEGISELVNVGISQWAPCKMRDEESVRDSGQIN